MDADSLLRCRRDTFSTSDLIYVAGVHFQHLRRCPRKLGDEGGPWTPSVAILAQASGQIVASAG